MKKLSLVLTMLCLALVLTTSSAMAFSLAGGYLGPVKFEFGSFDSGTTFYPAPGAAAVVANWPGVGADGSLPDGPGGFSVGADGVAGVLAPNSDPVTAYGAGFAPDTNFYPGGTAGEDSWAIFDVSVIRRPDTGTVIWTRGDAGEYLTGYFHHEVDHYVTHLGTDIITGLPVHEIRGVEGYVEMFLDTTDDYSGAAGPFGRNGFGFYGVGATYGYPGSAADDGSEGSLFLSLALGPGVVAGDLTTTFLNYFSFPASTGSGKMYLDITGGAFSSMFDTNSEIDPNGIPHDLFLSFTADPGISGWTVTNSGHALGTAVPEPTSMLLFGIGMLGLVTLRRKKAA